MDRTPQVAERLPANMRRVPVPLHVLDIDRRIREGDDIWRGDSSMGLYFDPASGMYEVWGLDANGTSYRAAMADYADQRLLDQLVAGDWQNTTLVFDRLEAENAKARAAIEQAQGDESEQMADKLVWALRRDAGPHLMDGLSRNLWSINWGGANAGE